MNDPIKYLITGAAIAIACGAMGTMGGVWIMKENGSGQASPISGQKFTVSGKPLTINTQPLNFNGQPSVFNGQRISQNPAITIPTRPVNGSNVTFRTAPATGKPLMTYSQFQKVQEVPEVKAAREALMEAQKKYLDTMKKAVESGQGAVANASKITPLTIQVPPAGSGTNEIVKGKM